MSFAEFQIRLFAWRRMDIRAWERTRFIAWNALIGPHSNLKMMPRSISRFLPLDFDKSAGSVSDEQKERFLEEYQIYLNNINNGSQS